jgi:hypothetical protein
MSWYTTHEGSKGKGLGPKRRVSRTPLSLALKTVPSWSKPSGVTLKVA